MTNVRMRRFLLLVGFLCLSAVVNAEGWKDKDRDGYTGSHLWYTWTDNSKTAVKVIKAQNGEIYSGDYTIPETISVNVSTKPNEYDYQPFSVTEIASEAFKGATYLTNVTINAAITIIYKRTFQNSGLTSITLPISLEMIDENAFASTSITSINIPENVTEIGNGAFQNSGLESISLPSSLIKIGANAFNNSKLTEITIPASVISIGGSAFNGCKLEKATFASIEALCNIYFDGDKSNPFAFAKKHYLGNSEIAQLFIPGTVENIPAYAFQNCEDIINITIEDGVKTIGASAFTGCKGLTWISIPNSITTIGKAAFLNNNKLKEVHYENLNSIFTISYGDKDANPLYYASELYIGEDKITELTIRNLYANNKIPDYAFRNCTSLTKITIDSGIKKIGASAFAGCSSLENIIIPNSIDSIGKAAFNGDNKLKKVYYENRNHIFEISYGDKDSNPLFYANQLFEGSTFQSNEEIRDLTIPTGFIPISSSDYQFFRNCTSLQSVTIEEGITTIGTSAFAGCTSLRNITLPSSITTIGKLAFQNDKSIEEIHFKDPSKIFTITYVENDVNANPISVSNAVHLYNNDEEIKTLNIPSTYSIIPAYAFRKCIGLEKINIAESVTSIGEEAFAGCENLKSVSLPSTITTIGKNAFKDDTNLTKARFASIISLCKIDYPELEQNATDLKPALQANPLYYAHNLYTGNNNEEEKEVSIPKESLKDGKLIRPYILAGAQHLTKVTIPEDAKEIGRSAFNGCSGLLIADYQSDKQVVEMVYQNQEANPLNYAKELRINGNKPYTMSFDSDIMPYAFANAQWLEGIEIGENVTSIGAGAFMDCKKLSGVTIKKGSKLTTIGEKAFYNCESLPHLDFSDISQLESIGDYAFNNCKSQQFTKMTIPANCSLGKGVFKICSELQTVNFDTNDQRTTISESCFEGCAKLDTITIPNTVTEIENYAFKDCKKLTTIPYGNDPHIETIGESAFANCTGFTEIAINNKVETLRAGAFSGCSEMKTVSLPEKITTILSNAFAACTKLENVIVYNSSVPFAHQYAFGGKQSQMKLYVPTSAKADYEKASVWKDFNGGKIDEYGKYTLAFHINDDVKIEPKSHDFNVGEAIGDEYRNYVPNLKEGESFSGWDKVVPLTMPNDHIDIYGYISKNQVIEGKENGFTYRFKYHLQPAEAQNNKKERATLIGVDSMDENYTDVVIPNSVKDNDNDDTYPVKTIGVRAFANYKDKGRILQITLPNNIEVVDTAAFRGCNQLWKVTNFEGITHVRDSVFFNCSSLSDIALSDNVTIIDTLAFYGCRHLNLDKLPSKLDSINYQAFANTGFEKISLYKDLKYLDNEAFKGCEELKTVDFEEGYNKPLPIRTFWNCTALNKVTLRGSMGAIHDGAFNGCSNLVTIDIPEGISTLGDEAFMGCKKLYSISLPETTEKINKKAFAGCDTLYNITVKNETPPTLISNAFDDKTYEKAYLFVKDGNAVNQYKEDNIWKNFKNLSEGGEHKLAFYVNDSMVKSKKYSIGAAIEDEFLNFKPELQDNELFSGWDKEIPVTMPNEDYKLYGYISKIETIADENGGTTYSFKYHLQPAEAQNNKQERATLIGVDYLDENYTTVVIPDDVTYDNVIYPVTVIGAKAFDKYKGKDKIRSITLPTNIAVVDTAAFRGCKDLEEVKNFNKITHARDSVFQNCANLDKIDLSNVVIIDTLAFSGCKTLRPVLSSQLDSINYQAFANTGIDTLKLAKVRDIYLDDEAFKGCANLTTVVIGGKYNSESLPIRAFWNCTALNRVTLEASIKSIHEGAFKGCTSLATVVIPEGVETLSREAFMGCNKLKTITLPSSILNIRDKAFAGDTLQSITVKRDVLPIPTLIENAFIDPTYQKAKLYVSDVDGYKNKNPWSKFGDNIQTIDNYTLTYIVDGNTETPYKTIPDVPVGTLIEPLDSAVNVGHKFSGWLGEPESMPGANVTVTGKFKYELKFSYADDSEQPANPKDFSLPESKWYFYGDSIKKEVLEKALQWKAYAYMLDSEIPETMPAKDLVITVKYQLAEQDTTISNIKYKVYLLTKRAEVTASPGVTEKYITIPATITYRGNVYNVKAIQEGAFARNQNIEKITLTADIDSIGKRAFFDNRFKEFTIPENVDRIGADAFLNCSSLEKLTFKGNKITELPDGVFSNCYALKSVILPSSITKIGKSAFAGSLSKNPLDSIVVNSDNGEMPVADPSSFDDIKYKNTKLRIKKSVYDNCPKDDKGVAILPTPWNSFVDKAPIGEESSTNRCDTVKISYDKGKLKFTCTTTGAQIVSWVEVDDTQERVGNWDLVRIYIIKAYAKKDGYIPSETVTRQITWRNGRPVFGKGFESVTLEEANPKKGDINEDGVIDTNDAIQVVRIYLGKE